MPSGIPRTVRHGATPVVRWPVASHGPARRNHTTFPSRGARPGVATAHGSTPPRPRGPQGDPGDPGHRDRESRRPRPRHYRKRVSDETQPQSATPTFADLGLGDAVLKALARRRLRDPVGDPGRARSRRCSPAATSSAWPRPAPARRPPSRCRSSTGSTCARRPPQALVLAPTRELALQVCEAFEKYAAHLKGVHVLPVYGGQGYGVQLSALRRGVHVVVGTPGRIMDHLEKGTLDLTELRFLVLDEADEMLNMGFAEDVETILADTPDAKQVALFSATMPRQIRRLSKKYLDDPVEITVKNKTTTSANITQRYLICQLPAEGRRPHPHPRGRELRGDDRLRPHQERDRDARREAAGPRATRRWPSTATSRRCSASAPSTSSRPASSTSSSPPTSPPAASTSSGSATSSTTTSPPTPSPTCTASAAPAGPGAAATRSRSSPRASATCSSTSRRPPASR